MPSLQAAELTDSLRSDCQYDVNFLQKPMQGFVLTSARRNSSYTSPCARDKADVDIARSGKGPDKLPLDPPPVLDFVVMDEDPSRSYLHSPYWFCTVSIETANGRPVQPGMLSGSLTSSLHKVKLSDGKCMQSFPSLPRTCLTG